MIAIGLRFSRDGSACGRPVSGLITGGTVGVGTTVGIGVSVGMAVGRVTVGRDKGVGAAPAYRESEALSVPG